MSRSPFFPHRCGVFFLTRLKADVPETRANGWTSSRARGLWFALLLELVVSCLLYCSKGTVVIYYTIEEVSTSYGCTSYVVQVK